MGSLISLTAVAAIWGIWRFVEDRTCRALLAEAKQEMSAGRYATAQSRLVALVARRPGWDEAVYNLGVCEQARDHDKLAIEAFERVSPDSPWAGWSDVRRSRLEMDRGRFAECENLLVHAAAIPGPHVAEGRWGLVLLLRLEGRFDEARRWLQDGFDAMTSPVETLRRLYKLDVDPFPIEGVRRALERAGKQAPDDDRVWLGKANLAIRLGEFAEAERWLGRCLDRRPDDPAVWRMKLECALASGRPDEVGRALPHLPAALEPDGRVAGLRAWLAASQGDRQGERLASEQSIALNPADTAALERLAALEHAAGRGDQAVRLRQAIRAIDEVRKQYVKLLVSASPETHAAELARLAERLGRRFDAARWTALAATSPTRGADQPRTTATVNPAPATSDGPTLADILRDSLKSATRHLEHGPATARAPLVIPRFTDDAQTVGLDFVQENADAGGRLIPPVTASGGVGLLDFDNDGWLDVYLVQGGPFPPEAKPSASTPGDRLFRNRGDGTFQDLSVPSGIGAMARGYGHGVAVGDFDNDGWADLFVTRWRSYALYRNKRDGTFEDVTEKTGLGGDRDWPTSAALADLDGDGDLDLYVCHYLKWDDKETRSCADPKDPTIYRCQPLDFEALPDHVFRNDGGRFVDITREAGIVDRNGRGLGVLAADVDDDGDTDLFVANDMTANYLFLNKGGFRFEETAHAAGVAGNASGMYQAGMGVACGDLDGDGRLDLAVTNFYNESTTFFRNLGQGSFTDQTNAIGLALPSRYRLGFGIAFLDANNDGWLDLITANGHVHDGRPQFPWKMPVQLFLGDGGGKLIDVSAQAGPPFQVLRMGRGLAAGDLDNDGRVDIVVVSQNEPVVYFHNRTVSDRGHFLTLLLEGTTSNRDAVAAKVSVNCSGRIRVAPRLGGGSYQSASDPRLRFGLGTARWADWVEVRWPSGRVDRFSHLAADTGHRLREGASAPLPLPGWKH
ncbi:MAG: FG-GAP-like repeat-containing protein [Isosphaerales bacterium]